MPELRGEFKLRCEDCKWRIVPFFYCSRFKKALKDKHSEILGCNIDGDLPPLPNK